MIAYFGGPLDHTVSDDEAMGASISVAKFSRPRGRVIVYAVYRWDYLWMHHGKVHGVAVFVGWQDEEGRTIAPPASEPASSDSDDTIPSPRARG